MRFLTRSLIGIFILSLTLGLIALAVSNVYRAIETRNAEAGRVRPPEERVFAVNVDTVTLGTVTPVITAYGEVASWRSLELRAATAGTVVEIAAAYRDGGRVEEGEVLVRIDPADAQAALDLARSDLAEAEAQAAEAEEALALAEADLAAAAQQRDLRAQALARQRDLLSRGAGTSAAVETAELALASAEQALVGRRQALSQARVELDLAGIAVRRRGISVRDAERTLAETTIAAPFAGLITAPSAVRGGLVANNEKLGTLIDTDALEVAFRVSNAQYARLIGNGGALADVGITATLALDEFPITVEGRLDRAGAEVGTGQTGRLLYARLDPVGARALRPGDFLTVQISEPPLSGVSVLPASAVNSAGEILLLGAEDRLEEAQVRVLRRQGDLVIVAGAPEGREYATERLPQLGAGVKIRPVRPGAALEAQETITLDAERRARLVAAVEANREMPAQARERVLTRLRAEAVPKELVERLEARLLGAGEEAGTVALDDARRARLIAFVEASPSMPAEVKARILAQLNAEEVPNAIVERLEARMGG